MTFSLLPVPAMIVLENAAILAGQSFVQKKLIDVAENLVLKPAKLANPSVKVTIKYPNWRESYHETGYVPKIQPSMFDKSILEQKLETLHTQISICHDI